MGKRKEVIMIINIKDLIFCNIYNIIYKIEYYMAQLSVFCEWDMLK